jgi:CrcB protein
MQFVWVGLGGAVGSMIRYAIALGAGRSWFPWATLSVNIAGSFLIGLLASWAMGRWPTAVTTALTVGLLGGFTTFSAFAWEGLSLFRSGRAAVALGYLVASVVGGLVAAGAGYALGRGLPW